MGPLKCILNQTPGICIKFVGSFALDNRGVAQQQLKALGEKSDPLESFCLSLVVSKDDTTMQNK